MASSISLKACSNGMASPLCAFALRYSLISSSSSESATSFSYTFIGTCTAILRPLLSIIIKIADALEVSIDYLVGKTDFELDKDTLRRIQDVSKLPAEEKKQVFMVIDALIRDFKTRKAYATTH